MMDPVDSGNTAWMLMSTALVMLMTPGLGFFHSGITGRKNMTNTIIMCMMSMALVTVQWVLIGYSFAFGTGKDFGNIHEAALRHIGIGSSDTYGVNIPILIFVAFQNMFAQITPALISGAVLGRMNFLAYIMFTLLWSFVVYNPIAYLVWALRKNAEGAVVPEGWLLDLGSIDFAGGTVIHISAGFSALIVSLMLGKKKEEENHQHNNVMIALGTSLLWFGWFGFNAGSQLAADGIAALAFINTHIAACVGLLSWVSIEYITTKKVSAAGAASGVIAGLVTITPGCGYVNPMFSFLFGFSGVFVCWSTLQFVNKMKIMYDLEAFALHGMAGITGALLTGLFAQSKWNPAIKDGAVFGRPKQLWYQTVSILVVAGLSIVGSFAILFLIKYTVGIKMTSEQKIIGADASYHDGKYFVNAPASEEPEPLPHHETVSLPI